MISPERSFVAGSDESFQKLLLRIAAKAGERSSAHELIQFFCQSTRDFFQVSGVYFWRCHFADELVGEQGHGKLAARFVGLRLRPDQSAVTAEAVRQRRTIFANHVKSAAFSAATEFEACSLMAVPLMVLNEVIGAVTFLHDSNEAFFNDDLAAQATIVAGQLGSLLEAARLNETSREEYRRAEILADVAHVLHGAPDVSAVIEALADRLRLLLQDETGLHIAAARGAF